MERHDFRKEKLPFTQVANSVLEDKNLSFKAKGLYAYLYSKPDGWDFSAVRIEKETKEGVKSIWSTLRELEEAGYLVRTKQKDGRVSYLLKINKSQTAKTAVRPDSQNGSQPKRQSAERAVISNTDIKVILSNSNTHSGQSPQAKLIPEVIKLFEAIDPKNKTYYGNKSQRAASEFLLAEYGLEEIKSRVALVQKANGTPYFPTITTPCQLKDKWVQLEKALERAGKQIVKEKASVLW